MSAGSAGVAAGAHRGAATESGDLATACSDELAKDDGARQLLAGLAYCTLRTLGLCSRSQGMRHRAGERVRTLFGLVVRPLDQLFEGVIARVCDAVLIHCTQRLT